MLVSYEYLVQCCACLHQCHYSLSCCLCRLCTSMEHHWEGIYAHITISTGHVFHATSHSIQPFIPSSSLFFPSYLLSFLQPLPLPLPLPKLSQKSHTMSLTLDRRLTWNVSVLRTEGGWRIIWTEDIGCTFLVRTYRHVNVLTISLDHIPDSPLIFHHFSSHYVSSLMHGWFSSNESRVKYSVH